MSEKYKVLRNAEKYVLSGKVGHAIKEYQKLLAKEPDEPTLLNTVGDLLLRQNSREEALSYFQKAAEVYLRSGFLVKAIAVFKKIYSLNPSDPIVNERLAELYQKQGLTFEAGKHLNVLVQHHELQGEFDRASSYLERIVNLNPGDPAIQVHLSEVLEKRRDKAGAFEHLQSAAGLYLAAEQLDEAFTVAQKALEIEPTNDRMLELFVGVALKTERAELVKTLLLTMLQKTGQRLPYDVFLAQIMEHEGDLDGAYQKYRELEPLAFGDPRVREGLARTTPAERPQATQKQQPFAKVPDGFGTPLMPGASRHEPGVFDTPETGSGIFAIEEEEPAQPQGSGIFELETEGSGVFGAESEDSDNWLSLNLGEPLGRPQARTEPQDLFGQKPGLTPLPKGGSSPIFEVSDVGSLFGPSESESVPSDFSWKPPEMEPAVEEEEEEEAFPESAGEQVPLADLEQGPIESLDEALQEADFYLKLGFREEAKKLLERLLHSYPRDERVRRRAEKVMSIPPELEEVEPAPLNLADELEAEMGPKPVPVDLGPMEIPGIAQPAKGSQAPEEQYFFKLDMEAGEPAATPVTPQAPMLDLDVTTAQEAAPAPMELGPVEDLTGEFGFDIEVDSALDSLFTGDGGEAPVEEVLRYDVASTASSDETNNPKVHYDLGLAYKEMGLIEDAIQEFQAAVLLLTDPATNPQKILCYSMLANSFLQLGRYSEAVESAEEGLRIPGQKEFEWKALKYDMCNALARQGQQEQAVQGFQEILARDPNYRDVKERVGQLLRVHG